MALQPILNALSAAYTVNSRRINDKLDNMIFTEEKS